MADWNRSSTSDNASVVSPDSTRVVALETTNEETSKLEFSEDEEMLIAKMFSLVRERWSLIAGRIPGRNADEIEKYWKSKYSKSQEEIQAQSQDEAHGIRLIEKTGPSTGHPQQCVFPEKKPISVCQPSDIGPQLLGPTTNGPQQLLGPKTTGPNNITVDQKLVNPAQDQINQ
ncbi:MYB-like transcription factor ATV [Solanum lycopersicum]|uniref:MYB-like transcriptional factor MYBATV-X1 transcript variant 1 n=2 Tax=Solanum lycopersicum TaxID=4081 RepID=A0A2H5AJN7_SOLLC|nr:MYB-like transcription factor ATV [Solanum lycopersicum]AUG72360.1 MYB-like transcriptional factor MYBATV-X1 transcript variant 1 [Solanum lycopersicum]